jgi:hypothetical protein
VGRRAPGCLQIAYISVWSVMLSGFGSTLCWGMWLRWGIRIYAGDCCLLRRRNRFEKVTIARRGATCKRLLRRQIGQALTRLRIAVCCGCTVYAQWEWVESRLT